MKGGDHLTIKLNKRAFEHAKRLIEKGSYVFDEKDMWSEHKPSAQEENEYIKKYKADMLAMVPHKQEWFERLFRKSETKDMIFHSKIPLLILPEAVV